MTSMGNVQITFETNHTADCRGRVKLVEQSPDQQKLLTQQETSGLKEHQTNITQQINEGTSTLHTEEMTGFEKEHCV